jgi:hypothetical protein
MPPRKYPHLPANWTDLTPGLVYTPATAWPVVSLVVLDSLVRGPSQMLPEFFRVLPARKVTWGRTERGVEG